MEDTVVITGIGAVTPLGIGAEESWQAMKEGRSGIGHITAFDAEGFPSRIAGEVKGFEPTQWLDKREAKHMDRFVQFAMVATAMALEDAQLKITPANAERVGVFIGSGIGGMTTWEEQHSILLKKGPQYVSPRLIPMMISDMASGHVSIIIGAKGPNASIVSACATASHAIGMAAMVIKQGLADAMICGGSEAAVTPLAMAGFANMRALSKRNEEPQRASRPFDAQRDGFVVAEGAGIVILESLASAVRRGAKVYAELCGFGMSGDAYHVTAMPEDGEGAVRSMQMALQMARLSAQEVDYINAHATSTPQGDPSESKAIRRVFDEHADKIAVSSTKSMIGHMLGAAGGVELIACLLAIRDNVIPPTINYEYEDPECDLDCVPNQARHKRVDVAMSNSFGFGGHNASLLVRRFDG